MNGFIVILCFMMFGTPVISDKPSFQEESVVVMSDVECQKLALPVTQTVTMEVTAYTHTGNPTKSGVMPEVGHVAVDPKVIPLGSEVYVDGFGWLLATDTGGLIKGNKLDVFMDTRSECVEFGRQKLEVKVIKRL